MAAVCPDQVDVLVQLAEPGPQAGGRFVVAHVRGGHGYDRQQPQESVTTCRFLPLIDLPPSWSREAEGIDAVAFTDWAWMTPCWRLRLAALTLGPVGVPVTSCAA